MAEQRWTEQESLYLTELRRRPSLEVAIAECKHKAVMRLNAAARADQLAERQGETKEDKKGEAKGGRWTEHAKMARERAASYGRLADYLTSQVGD